MTRAYCATCGKELDMQHGRARNVYIVQPCKHCLVEAAQAAIEGMQDHLADMGGRG